jgi:hypothetical protein
MEREFRIGDNAYLKEPFRGYRYVEVVGYDGLRLVVRLSNGYETTVYEDELERED